MARARAQLPLVWLGTVSSGPAVSDDIDIRDTPAKAVRFRCLTCGETSERPTGYLVRTYGVATLGEVRARARCLRYIGGERCGGRAALTLADRLLPPLPGGTNARRIADLDDALPPERQGG